ncbi:hypothetical protein E2542_SST09140 [Spatholobus suberectus]|nr:hypothetical protein E2542_SST09140 [Spatholobus suberectus]
MPNEVLHIDPVCGTNDVTYWCGCVEATYVDIEVAKLGFCEVGNGGTTSILRQALLLVHIVWLIVLRCYGFCSLRFLLQSDYTTILRGGCYHNEDGGGCDRVLWLRVRWQGAEHGHCRPQRGQFCDTCFELYCRKEDASVAVIATNFCAPNYGFSAESVVEHYSLLSNTSCSPLRSLRKLEVREFESPKMLPMATNPITMGNGNVTPNPDESTKSFVYLPNMDEPKFDVPLKECQHVMDNLDTNISDFIKLSKFAIFLHFNIADGGGTKLHNTFSKASLSSTKHAPSSFFSNKSERSNLDSKYLD